jgi:hypothetical protein
MIYDQDPAGGYPLSMREYDALRQMMGAVSALDCDTLKPRCQLKEGTWEKLTRARDDLQEVMTDLFSTIPTRKLLSMRRELANTVCTVHIKPPSTTDRGDFVYVAQKNFIELIQRAIQMDCQFCDKTLKECKKCTLFKNIQDCFPYELYEPTDTLCPFAGVSRLEAEKQ